MTVDERLDALRELIQGDVGHRGLARDPADNLLTRCRGDLAAACRSIAETPRAVLGVVTGFYIPTAAPPSGETDGPLGAVFLARALSPLGVRVVLASDPFCRRALKAGLRACDRLSSVPVLNVPREWEYGDEIDRAGWWEWGRNYPPGTVPRPTHVLALERVGPSHTLESVGAQREATADAIKRFGTEVPADHRNRCHNMRGRDITEHTRDAHFMFEPRLGSEAEEDPQPITIGIGDGGNEIGMGKLPWDTIRRNIPDGGLIACRVPADHLIVAGVSNWGAYALAAGVLLLRGEKGDADLFDPDRERELLRVMVERGPLVDGVTGRATATVDGLTWEQYAEPLAAMGRLL